MRVGMKEKHYREIERHYDSIAKRYLTYKKRNRYYHSRIASWLKANVPPQKKVLEFGCGQADVLRLTRPAHAVGVDLSEEMVAEARRANPDYHFEQAVFEDAAPGEQFDCVLAVNSIEYAYDVSEVLKQANRALRDSGKLYLVTGNPIWEGIFKLASRLGLRQPDTTRLFLTNLDIANLLKINGFEVTNRSMGLVLPKYLPLVSNPVNWVVQRLPLIRLLGSTQFLVARKIPEKPQSFSVSIVVPCYNEAGNIKTCIERVEQVGSSTELIFVDDGSTDGTADEVEKWRHLRKDIEINCVSYSPNRGKGSAVKTGLDSAKGDLLFILDADLTTEPEEFREVYEILANGHADFVNCTRLVYPLAEGAMKTANYIGNKVFTTAVSLVMESRVSDTLCGTKAFFKHDYKYFRMGRDPWGDYDLLFGAGKLRLSVAEYPVHYQERVAGASKMQPLKHGLNLLRMCVAGFRDIKFSKSIEIQNDLENP